MRKLFQLVFGLVLIAFFVWFGLPFFLPQSSLPDSLVLSTDAIWTPATKQEIVVYALNKDNRDNDHQTNLKLKARISNQNLDKNENTSFSIKLPYTTDGAYSQTIEVPGDWLSGTATIEILTDDFYNVVLHKSIIEIGIDNALMVIPPDNEIFAGSWLNFRIASIDRKTGEGIFKTPVRVKFTSPAGCTTTNRVIHTDLEGFSVFTTHLNNRASAGNYSLSFSNNKDILDFDFKVGSRLQKNQLLNKQLRNSFKGFLPFYPFSNSNTDKETCGEISPEYQVVSSKSDLITSGDLSDIKLAKQQAILSYGCPDSSYRRIEIWQNGKIIYSSDLQLESGRISIPFYKPLLPNKPIRFKLWFIRNKQLVFQEQTIINPDCANTPMAKMLQDADNIFKVNNNIPFTSSLLTSQSLISISPSENLKTAPSIFGQSIKISAIYEPNPCLSVETTDMHKSAPIPKQPLQRFFLVKDELLLNRYGFSTLKIWLEPRKFFSSLISATRKNEKEIDFLIGEAECRALRFPYLNLAEQGSELEKLEGLLIPLCEYYIKNKSSETKDLEKLNRSARAILRLGKLVYIPNDIFKKVESDKINFDKIGPFSPVLAEEFSISELLNALKQEGRANIKTEERIIPLVLTGNYVSFFQKSMLFAEGKPEKLINTRSAPILVELDFTDF